MNGENKERYTIGLDIGTNSVGWCVLDGNNDIVKRRGKSLWGARIFDPSESAKERRLFRGQRRRYQRRKERIKLLREIFSDEINSIDTNFFTRMNESYFLADDSTIPSKNLFESNKDSLDDNSRVLSNREYYEKYPTIWHLRNHLINSEEKEDIRFIYLALHHIIKYRGNFLREGNINAESNLEDIKKSFETINELIAEQRGFSLNNMDPDDNESDYTDFYQTVTVDDKLIHDIISISSDISLSKKDKLNKLLDLFSTRMEVNTDKSYYKNVFLPLFISSKIKLSNIKSTQAIEDKNAAVNIESENFDAEIEELIREYPFIRSVLTSIVEIKNIQNTIYLYNLLGSKNGKSTKRISTSFIRKYDEYHEDLNNLKHIVKTYFCDKYNHFFKEEPKKNEINYVILTGKTDVNGIKKNCERCTLETFYSIFNIADDSSKKKKSSKSSELTQFDLAKLVNEIEDSKDKEIVQNIINRISNNLFLAKINSSKNTAIPNQLHFAELKEIISKQKKFYPILFTEDNIKKIESIFTFKRPYYVGTLKGERSWAILNDTSSKIYPWNFDEFINKSETQEIFINRMQRKCTYLKGSDDYCLPLNSIIFQEYLTYEYLNKLKVDGKLIDEDTKEYLFNMFVQKGNEKPTKSKIRAALKSYLNHDFEDPIPDCNIGMKTYILFDSLPEFKGKVFNNLDLIEEIVKYITIMKDKDNLLSKLDELSKKYNISFSESTIKTIKGFNFNKFGKLSRRLLTDIKAVNPETGEETNLIGLLKESNMNMMEILYNPDTEFKANIDDYNSSIAFKDSEDETKSFSDVINNYVDNNLNISANYKTAFIQTVKVVDEILDILGRPNLNTIYFAVETTRTNESKDKGKKTDSRLESMKALYKAASKTEKEISSELKAIKAKSINQLSKELDSAENLNRTKLFLYYQQMGIDLYSMEPIDINNFEAYDIDHIYPQAAIYDDSLSNKVLTLKVNNQHYKKANFLPDCIELMCKKEKLNMRLRFIKFLYDNKFINEKKYTRLTEKEIDELALQGFINRQKTTTDQTVTAVIKSLKDIFKVNEDHIIYSKAEIVTKFRQINQLYKCREANNFHHAHDAYLNAFLGYTLKKYYADRHVFSYKDYNKDAVKLTGEDTQNYSKTNNMLMILNYYPKYSLSGNGKVIWNGKADIEKITKNIYENFDVHVTHRTVERNNLLKKVTIKPKDNGTVKIKDKTPNGNNFDIQKYGGIDSFSYVGMVICKCKDTKSGEIFYKLISVNKAMLRSDNLEDELKSAMGKNQEFIEIVKICKSGNNLLKFGSIFKFEDTEYRITGTTNSNLCLINNREKHVYKDLMCLMYKFYKLLPLIKIKENYDSNSHEFKLYESNYLNKDINGNPINLVSFEELENLLKGMFGIYRLKSSSNKMIYGFSAAQKILKEIENIYHFPTDFSYEEFVKLAMLTDKVIKYLDTNHRNPIDFTIIGSSGTQKGFLISNGNIKSGTKIYSESPTGLRRTLLFEVK